MSGVGLAVGLVQAEIKKNRDTFTNATKSIAYHEAQLRIHEAAARACEQNIADLEECLGRMTDPQVFSAD